MVFGLYPAAVFRRRSRRGRFVMTTITTVRRNARSPYNYGRVEPRNACNQFVRPRNGVPASFPFTLTTGLYTDELWYTAVAYRWKWKFIDNISSTAAWVLSAQLQRLLQLDNKTEWVTSPSN